MVFYNQLPKELWFKIYKIEHNINLLKVNKEIKNIFLENEKITKGIIKNIKTRGYLLENLLFYINTYPKPKKTIKIYLCHYQIEKIKHIILNKHKSVEINILNFKQYYFIKQVSIYHKEIYRRLNELKNL